MSKTLSGAPTCAPIAACESGVPPERSHIEPSIGPRDATANGTGVARARARALSSSASQRQQRDEEARAYRQPLQVAPLIVGPANALAATGFNWRWVRDFWVARGRAFVGSGKKRGIVAAALLDELARAGTECPSAIPQREPELVDAAEAVRRAIGLRGTRP